VYIMMCGTHPFDPTGMCVCVCVCVCVGPYETPAPKEAVGQRVVVCLIMMCLIMMCGNHPFAPTGMCVCVCVCVCVCQYIHTYIRIYIYSVLILLCN
jgi:hypothetical protein